MSNHEQRNLKVGIVCYPTHGGSGVVAVELAHALARRGHKIDVISYKIPPRLNTLHEGITFHSVPVPDYPLFDYPPYSLALAAKLAEVINEKHLDLLHVHYAIPHAVSGWLARTMSNRTDLPLITTLHGTDITIVGNDPIYLPITRFSLEVSDTVTVVSKWLGEQTRSELGCSYTPDVVYNFVDPERYRPRGDCALRHRIKLNGSPVLMHMSNFRAVKRIPDVVDTFLRVREQLPVQLVLVGDGPERSKAEAGLKSSRFAADVHFLGIQNEAEEVLAAADLFLLPSNAESFGLAALEAMACGVPVIGANVGGLPEVVVNGVSGRLTEVGDVEAMAKICLDLLNNPEDLEEMSGKARETACTKFTESSAVDRYEEIYRESIIARKN